MHPAAGGVPGAQREASKSVSLRFSFWFGLLKSGLGFTQTSVITSKAANSYHFKTGQRDWPSRTENVLPCRLLWWQVGFGAPAPRTALEHMAVVQ